MLRNHLSILVGLGLIASLLGCGAVIGTGVSGGAENPAALGAVGPNHSGMNGDVAAEDNTANQGGQASTECSGSVCNVDTPLGHFEDPQ